MTFLQQLRALLLICSSCIMWAQAPPEANKLVVVSEIKIQDHISQSVDFYSCRG
jgi:hypothetical protein